MVGVYDLLVEQIKHKGSKCALIFEEMRYSFKELNEHINQFSYILKENGVVKSTKVGLLLQNSPEFVFAFFASMKLGACVSLFNFRSGASEILTQQSIVRSEIIVYNSEYMSLVKKIAEQHDIKSLCVDGRECEDYCGDYFSKAPKDFVFREEISEHDPAINIFTGGTTGEPKAAVHSQGGIFMNIIGKKIIPQAIEESDVYAVYAPLFHIGGLTHMLMCTCLGCKLCLMRGFNQDDLFILLQNERVSNLALIPPTIVDAAREYEGLDLSCVRAVTLSGGSCNELVAKKVFELMPYAKVRVTFGHTENALLMQSVQSKEEFIEKPHLIQSVGKPCVFYEAKLVDDFGVEVEVGQAGELWGRSPAMMVGYLGKESFEADNWFATGDIMRQDEEGNYYFLSRKKDMIKSGGENVYAIEVENALITNKNVKACAVVGLPHARLGEMVVAAVVKHSDATVTEQELIDYCKSSIASYKKPKKIFFVDSLPKRSIGKVQKYVLREELRELYENE